MNLEMVKKALATVDAGVDVATQKSAYTKKDVVVLDQAIQVLAGFIGEVEHSLQSKPQQEEKPKELRKKATNA